MPGLQLKITEMTQEQLTEQIAQSKFPVKISSDYAKTMIKPAPPDLERMLQEHRGETDLKSYLIAKGWPLKPEDGRPKLGRVF